MHIVVEFSRRQESSKFLRVRQRDRQLYVVVIFVIMTYETLEKSQNVVRL